MQPAKLRGLRGIVEEIVRLRHAFVVPDHERSAALVVLLADSLKIGTGFPTLRKGKGLEAIGRGVTESVFEKRSEESGLDFVSARRESVKGSEGFEREDDQRSGKCLSDRNEREGCVLPDS